MPVAPQRTDAAADRRRLSPDARPPPEVVRGQPSGLYVPSAGESDPGATARPHRASGSERSGSVRLLEERLARPDVDVLAGPHVAPVLPHGLVPLPEGLEVDHGAQLRGHTSGDAHLRAALVLDLHPVPAVLRRVEELLRVLHLASCFDRLCVHGLSVALRFDNYCFRVCSFTFCVVCVSLFI